MDHEKPLHWRYCPSVDMSVIANDIGFERDEDAWLAFGPFASQKVSFIKNQNPFVGTRARPSLHFLHHIKKSGQSIFLFLISFFVPRASQNPFRYYVISPSHFLISHFSCLDSFFLVLFAIRKKLTHQENYMVRPISGSRNPGIIPQDRMRIFYKILQLARDSKKEHWKIQLFQLFDGRWDCWLFLMKAREGTTFFVS